MKDGRKKKSGRGNPNREKYVKPNAGCAAGDQTSDVLFGEGRRQASMSFRIIGTGSYTPPTVVSNNDLLSFLDTDDQWIVSRTGIQVRHVCTTESTSDLATLAARNALENAKTSVDEIDMILCATISGESICPSMASMVQRNLKAQCACLDINAACTAWIYLMDTAAAFFCKGGIRKMLVIGTEAMSRILDWTDRATCVLFGDGAGAVVLEAGDNYLASSFVTNGNDQVISVPTHHGVSPWDQREERVPLVHMNGQEVYKFAVSNMPKRIMEVLEKAQVAPDDVKWVIPHQANKRIIDATARRVKGIPPERFCCNIHKYGNTSSATIPIVLDEWNRAGLFQRGDLLVLTAAGAGLSSAACLIRW